MTPFKFTLGANQVIKGWEIGVRTMKRGEKAILNVDSLCGYGSDGC